MWIKVLTSYWLEITGLLIASTPFWVSVPLMWIVVPTSCHWYLPVHISASWTRMAISPDWLVIAGCPYNFPYHWCGYYSQPVVTDCCPYTPFLYHWCGYYSQPVVTDCCPYTFTYYWCDTYVISFLTFILHPFISSFVVCGRTEIGMQGLVETMYEVYLVHSVSNLN